MLLKRFGKQEAPIKDMRAAHKSMDVLK